MADGDLQVTFRPLVDAPADGLAVDDVGGRTVARPVRLRPS